MLCYTLYLIFLNFSVCSRKILTLILFSILLKVIQLAVWLEHQWDVFKLLGSYHVLVHKVDMGRPIVR